MDFLYPCNVLDVYPLPLKLGHSFMKKKQLKSTFDQYDTEFNHYLTETESD